MKTTIAITKEKRITVSPNKIGGVTLETGIHNEPILLTLDQAGALIFALEQAADTIEIQQQRNDAVADVAAL